MTSTTSTNIIIPWPCLIDPPTTKPQPIPNPKPVPKNQQKTFAQALSNVCDVPLSQLPQTCMKGDKVAIEIPEDEYLAGMDECIHSLH